MTVFDKNNSDRNIMCFEGTVVLTCLQWQPLLQSEL